VRLLARLKAMPFPFCVCRRGSNCDLPVRPFPLNRTRLVVWAERLDCATPRSEHAEQEALASMRVRFSEETFEDYLAGPGVLWGVDFGAFAGLFEKADQSL
jgi:hypothetical protein